MTSHTSDTDRPTVPQPLADEAGGVPPGSLVLVTGSSGYVGGRLVTVLLEHGYRVRCLVRTPAKVASAPWHERVEIVQGDVGGDLTEAMTGVDAAFYLVHSIGSSAEWAEHDRAVAGNFRRAAGVARGAGRGNVIMYHVTTLRASCGNWLVT